MKSRYAWLMGCAAVAAACGMAGAFEEGAAPAPRRADPAVEEWVKVLATRITDGNEVVRRSAVHGLIAVGPDALPTLGKLAGSEDPKTAGTAMDLIAAIKHRGPGGPGGPGGHRGPGGPGGPEGMRHGPGGPGMGPGPGGPRGPGRMLEGLGLSDDQKAKVQEVMKATHERVRKETEAELQKILTPEQWQKMQESHGPRGPREGGPGGPR